MRTNEELAMLAKERNRGAMAELWEQVYWLIHKMLGKYYPLCARYGVEPEDLTQSAYFALVRAVDAYDSEKEFTFSTYLTRHVSKAAREALGFHGSGKSTPPPFVKSLDEPLLGAEDESLTLVDTIPDESAEAAFEDVRDRWQREQLRACLNDCIASMPPGQADTLRARFFEDKTLRIIAEEKGCSLENIRQFEAKGLRQLRHPQYSRILRPFLDYDSCYGYSLTAFRDRGYVSRVEVLAGTW